MSGAVTMTSLVVMPRAQAVNEAKNQSRRHDADTRTSPPTSVARVKA